MPPRRQDAGFDANGHPINKEHWEYDANKNPVYHKLCGDYLLPTEKSIMDHLGNCCRVSRPGVQALAQPPSATAPQQTQQPQPALWAPQQTQQPQAAEPPTPEVHTVHNPFLEPRAPNVVDLAALSDARALSDAGTEYESVVSSRRSMRCRDCGSEDHTHRTCPLLASTRAVVNNVDMLFENGLGGTLTVDLPKDELPKDTLIHEHWYSWLRKIPVTAEVLIGIYKGASPQFQQEFEQHVSACMTRIRIETDREQAKVDKHEADIKERQLNLQLEIEKTREEAKREAERNKRTWFGMLTGSVKKRRC